MNQEIIRKLKYNYLMSLNKTPLDKIERARVIISYMEEYKLSGREFARIFNIPKSTVEDWLLYNRITAEELKQMKRLGLSHKDIYKYLRGNKQTKTLTFNRGEVILERVLGTLKAFPCNIKFNAKIYKLLNDIRKEVDKIEVSK